MVNKTCF